MEEKPRRDAPRARDPRAPFSAPDDTAGDARPARRGAPPAVTFQPPQPDASAESHSSGAGESPRRSSRKPVPPQPSRTEAVSSSEPPPRAETATPPAAEPPAAEPPAKAVAKKTPVKKAAPAKTTVQPQKAVKKAAAVKAAAVKATPVKAAPVKRAPAKKAAKAAAPVAAPLTPAVAPEETPAVETTPVPTPEPRATEPGTTPPDQLAAFQDLWSSLLADPAQSPETLAHAAVDTLGPRAQTWADQIRARYPQATPDAIARLATRRFTRSAGLRTALSATAGLYTPLTLLATAAFTHAELVLHLAAAYHQNPTDQARAADLLRLAPLDPRRLAGAGATWVALRLTSRVFPGTSLVAAVLTAQSAIEATAVRARRHFRPS